MTNLSKQEKTLLQALLLAHDWDGRQLRNQAPQHITLMDDVIAEFIEKRPNRAAMVSRSRLMTLSNTVIDDIESRKDDPDVVACL